MPLIPGVRAGDEQPYGPQVTFRSQDILPPSAVYLGKDDTVVLNVRSPGVVATLDVDVRFLDPQGVIKPMQFQQVVQTSGATASEFVLFQAEGFLLSASIFGTALSRGQCFVKLYVKRGSGSQDSNNGPLFVQGYASADDWLSYPTSPTESSLNGRGWFHIVSLASPGPNLPITFTVPAGRRWILRSVRATFFAAAVVGNRSLFLQIIDNIGGGFCVLPATALVPALTINFLTWGTGLQNFAPNTNQTMALINDLILPPGWQFLVGFNTPDPNDGFQNASALVEEYVAL